MARGIVAAPGELHRSLMRYRLGAELRGGGQRPSARESDGPGTMADTLAIAVTSSRAPKGDQAYTKHHRFFLT
jgi:hypothetical protein